MGWEVSGRVGMASPDVHLGLDEAWALELANTSFLAHTQILRYLYQTYPTDLHIKGNLSVLLQL